MNTLRRILVTAVAAVAVSGLASADTIIGYTTSFGPTSTDITNTTATLPSWDPGDLNTTTSNVTKAGTYTTGISMASLNSPGITYTLVGWDITVKETLTGNYTLTNTSTNSTATGSAYVDSYTAISLNGPLAPPLTNTSDPSNDLYNKSVTGVGVPVPPNAQGEQVLSIGGGPDPNAPALTGLSLAPNGGTTNSGAIMNVNSGYVDLGCELNNLPGNGGGGAAFCTTTQLYAGAANQFDGNLGFVSGSSHSTTDPLTFYFSTATQTDSALTGGNVVTTYNTSVAEVVTVTYDYTTSATSSTPEPTTMVLFGTALIGLGLLRRRARQQ